MKLNYYILKDVVHGRPIVETHDIKMEDLESDFHGTLYIQHHHLRRLQQCQLSCRPDYDRCSSRHVFLDQNHW